MEPDAETEKAEIFGQAEIFQSLNKTSTTGVARRVKLLSHEQASPTVQDSCCAARAKQGLADSRFNFMIRS